MPNTIQAAAEGMPNDPTVMPEEHPWEKARRLSKELSEALAKCDDAGWAAHIMPMGSAFAVQFSAIQPEHPKQRVDRLSAELSEALDDYAGARFHVRVYPSLLGGHNFFYAATGAHDREGV